MLTSAILFLNTFSSRKNRNLVKGSNNSYINNIPAVVVAVPTVLLVSVVSFVGFSWTVIER